MKFKSSIALIPVVWLGFFHCNIVGQDTVEAEKGVMVQYPNSPLPSIILYYEELTGLRTIRDATLEGMSLSVDAADSMTRDEAIRFIEKTLLLNGIAIIPEEEGVVKVVSVVGKSPRSEGLSTFSELTELPKGDQIVNFLIRLDNIAAEDAVIAFREIAPSHNYGVISAVPNARAVIVTDTTRVIRSLVKLRDLIDVPPSITDQKSFPLERANAEEVVEALKELLGLGESQKRSSSSITPGGVAASGLVSADSSEPIPALLPEDRGSSLSVGAEPQIYAITRTNRVVAIGRPIELARIGALIEEFDRPVELGELYTRKLEYQPVGDVLQILSDALVRTFSDGTGGGGADGSGDDQNNVGTRGGAIATPADAGGGTRGSGSPSLTEPADPGGPVSLLVGKTLLIANPIANMLSASGPPDHLAIIDQIIDNVDTRPQQIYISIIIGQLSLGDDYEFGLDLLRTMEGLEVNGQRSQTAGVLNSGATGGGFPNPGFLTTPENFAGAAAGLSLYGEIGSYMDAYLNVLEASNRFKILSRPSVFALNNTKAVIATGERVAVPVSTFTGSNGGDFGGGVTANIDFQDVVLKLEVIPLVNSDGEVTLKIAQVNDDIVGATNIGGNSIPTIGTQQMVTSVIVPDGHAVLLGGLVSESESKVRTGIPLISSIPILGRITGSERSETERRELVVFIRPEIISTDAEIDIPAIDMRGRARITPDLHLFEGESQPVGENESDAFDELETSLWRARGPRRMR